MGVSYLQEASCSSKVLKSLSYCDILGGRFWKVSQYNIELMNFMFSFILLLWSNDFSCATEKYAKDMFVETVYAVTGVAWEQVLDSYLARQYFGFSRFLRDDILNFGRIMYGLAQFIFLSIHLAVGYSWRCFWCFIIYETFNSFLKGLVYYSFLWLTT